MVVIKKRSSLISNAEKKNRINREINAPEVRLIDADGNMVGTISSREALEIAARAELDLVEISPNATPPVCRLMDYRKYLFEQGKVKKKQKKIDIKEMTFRVNTGKGDYQTKLKKLISFLEDGHKVKITLRYRGRELSHKELGQQLMDNLKIDLANHCVIEKFPELEGRQVVMMIGPKKK